ncbi:putative RNA-directed DNA polymerase, eukaryota, reverse transcriptase zinc-binding domain protein [Tanacetum coccineum]|uniref:RNA-directed DNA polymerase, eukaryota, reverse transcriptase zinc-binding domain protein n=1 Tax=Tanacetum coccineum TaxID=301880 RepID=A0ABQ4ZU45_9ASTR
MVAYLQKSEGSEGFHQIIDFLTISHIKYALTESPTIYASLIDQFWQTIALSTIEDGVMGITATIDRKVKVLVSEASIRRHLKLEDADGIRTLPTAEIFEQLTLMGIRVKDQKSQLCPITHPLLVQEARLLAEQEELLRLQQEQENYDFEKALELQKQLDEREEVVAKVNQAYDIDWSDPVVLRYHALQNRAFSKAEVRKNMCTYLKNQGGYKMSHFKEMSYEDIRPIFERVWDQINAFIPKDSNIEKEVMKRSGFVQKQPAGEEKEKKKDAESSKQVEEEINVNILIPSSSLKDKDPGQREELAKDKERQEQEKYDLEKALELQKQLDERKEVVVKEAHDIDWSDPAVIRYHALQNRSFSIAEDQNHTFIPKDYEIEKDVMKRPGFDLQQESIKKNEKIEALGFVQKQPTGEEKEKKKDAESSKKVEEEILAGNLIAKEMWDIMRYTGQMEVTRLMCSSIMFEPDENDEVWKNHNSQELIEWKLYDSCRVHSLMLRKVTIHMLVEKKYPLPQDTLIRMLRWKLHVNYDVTEMAYELLSYEDTVANMNGDGLFMNKLPSDKALFMVRQVTNDEIKDAIFNIGNDKAPGPDGFTSVFFKKAWDNVGEDVCFRFHDTMIKWIMACISSTSYSINVNGELHGYFKGKRGLRQGYPISPYLFIVVMEILMLMLKRRVRESGDFGYHNRCSKQKIINICFVDYLIMFSRGDIHSAKILIEALEEFKYALGLVPSILKSTIFFCNVVAHVKTAILQLMPFEEVHHLSYRAIHNARFSIHDKVADLILDNDADGMFRPFSVSLAWNSIRERRDVVQWSYIVWSRHSIPRHAAHMWLVMKRWILLVARRNNDICIMGHLILAASLYYILQEQNNRIHANGASCARSVERVASVILDIVRLKLGTIKFKRNARVAKLKTT